MEYTKPVLRDLGSFSELTLGMNGSCPDGNSNNIILHLSRPEKRS